MSSLLPTLKLVTWSFCKWLTASCENLSVRFSFLFLSFFKNTISDGDFTTGGEKRTLCLHTGMLRGHTGVTKSHRSRADGAAGLVRE